MVLDTISKGKFLLIFLPSIHYFVIIKKGENVDLDPCLLMFTKQMDSTNIFSKKSFQP